MLLLLSQDESARSAECYFQHGNRSRTISCRSLSRSSCIWAQGAAAAHSVYFGSSNLCCKPRPGGTDRLSARVAETIEGNVSRNDNCLDRALRSLYGQDNAKVPGGHAQGWTRIRKICFSTR